MNHVVPAAVNKRRELTFTARFCGDYLPQENSQNHRQYRYIFQGESNSAKKNKLKSGPVKKGCPFQFRPSHNLDQKEAKGIRLFP